MAFETPTDINAFHLDVQDAKRGLEQAQGRLSEANRRLNEKMVELGEKPKADEPAEKPRTSKVVRSAKSGQFAKKSEAKKNPHSTVTESNKQLGKNK